MQKSDAGGRDEFRRGKSGGGKEGSYILRGRVSKKLVVRYLASRTIYQLGIEKQILSSRFAGLSQKLVMFRLTSRQESACLSGPGL